MKKFFKVILLVLLGIIIGTWVAEGAIIPLSYRFSGNAAYDGLNSSFYNGQEIQIQPGHTARIDGFIFRTNGNATSNNREWDFALFAENGNILASTTLTEPDFIPGEATSDTDVKVLFDNPVNATGTVFIGFKYISGEGAQLRTQDPGAYGYGCRREYDGVGAITDNACTSEDLYFEVVQSVSYGIEIVYPVNSSSTPINNFGLWRVNYNVATSTGTGWINIFVNTTSSVSTANYLWFDQELRSLQIGNYTNSALNRLPPSSFGFSYASGTVYYAVAELRNTGGTLATSTVVAFKVGDVDEELEFAEPPPLAEFLAGFQDDSQNLLRDKFPLAYFYDVGDIISNYEDQADDQFLEIKLTLFSSSTYEVEVVVFSSSTIEELTGSDNIDLLKDALGWSLYLGFAGLVWTQSKTLFKR